MRNEDAGEREELPGLTVGKKETKTPGLGKSGVLVDLDFVQQFFFLGVKFFLRENALIKQFFVEF